MYELVVNPQKMLRVIFQHPTEGEREVTALTCAYVPAISPNGETSVAIELVWDPHDQNPRSPYTCPVERLERLLLSPSRLKKIRPYEPV